MGLQFLSYSQIDKAKWDACIDAAGNGLVYAYSFYLDNMAKHWDALILNDYEAVMPLTWNKKFDIAYLHTPPFIQQLGIFSKTVLPEDLIRSFVAAVQQRFRFAELFVNFNNGTGQPNYVLSLHQSYDLIRQRYKPTLLKSLKHAARFSFNYLEEENISEAVNMSKNQYGGRLPHIKEQDYRNFEKLCKVAKNKGGLAIRKVIDENNATLAIVLLLKDKRRLYNIISAVTQKGRQCEANYYLYDKLIMEFAGQQMVLDFEGSSIEGIASFYQKFGTHIEPYFLLGYNNLPWPIKYLKKRY
ncbi:MAG: hypothetical protein ABIN01_06930 [Ferruginibacter sp.]